MEDSFRVVGRGGIQHKGTDEGRKETGPLAGINGLMKEKLYVMAPSSLPCLGGQAHWLWSWTD